MTKRSLRSTLGSVATACSLFVAGCGEDANLLESVTVLDSHAEFDDSGPVARIAGSYLLEVRAADGNSGAVKGVVTFPQVTPVNANQLGIGSWSIETVRSDVTEPLSIEPGQVARVSVSFTLADAGPPVSAWSSACFGGPASVPPVAVSVLGLVVDGNYADPAPSYSSSIVIEGQLSASEPPASNEIDAAFVVPVGSGSMSSLSVHDSGDVVVASDTTISTSEGFVARVRPDGTLAWTHTLTTTARAAAGGGGTFVAAPIWAPVDVFGVHVEPADGDVYVAKLDDAGAPEWLVPLQQDDEPGLIELLADDAASVVLVANRFSMSNTNPHAALVKLDAQGGVAYDVQLPNVVIAAAAARDDGTVVVAGDVIAPTDLGAGPLASGTRFAAAIDAAGVLAWSTSLNMQFDAIAGVALAADGSVTVATASLIVRLDAAGSQLWSRPMNGAESSGLLSVQAIAAAPDGSMLVAADLNGQRQFGSVLLDSAGAQVRILAELDPQGAPAVAGIVQCTPISSAFGTRLAWSPASTSFVLGTTVEVGPLVLGDAVVPGTGVIVAGLAP